ncbi:MAG: hypothetical protein HFK04_03600 [Oscillospiraceae bacterium]|nr:hypothetical protein [Oscillospiraceae bacterium]
MKTLFSLFLSFLLIPAPLYEDTPFIQPVSADSSENFSHISVCKDEIWELSARQLEIRLGLEEGKLPGIIVTALPDNGRLILDGVPVSEFSQLSREELDRLCFVPGEKTRFSGFSFIPDCADRSTATLSIAVEDQVPAPPQARDLQLYTWSDVPTGSFSLLQDQTQELFVHITQSPQKGIVRTDGLSLTYLPFSGIHGQDSFSYVLVDRYGNFSTEATAMVNIEKNKNGFVFSDLIGRPEAASAITLHKKSILCGEKVGESWYFYPDDPISCGQFLICLLAAKNTPISSDSVQTGLSNDEALPLWLKPYLKSAMDAKFLTETSFLPDEYISLAQAKTILHRAFDSSSQKIAFSSAVTALGPAANIGPASPEENTPLTRAAFAVMLAEMTNNFPS